MKPGGTLSLHFIGVGPQRTSTSWLDAVLRSHPDIALPEGVKETMFFDRHYGRGPDWYEAHFRNVAPAQVCGEIGPTYFDTPETVDRIHRWSPGCRIIVSLRNPAERTFSLYLHHLAKGRVRGSLREAAEQMPRILTSGHYASHIPGWIDRFGGERTCFILQEDVAARPREVLSTLYRFLDVADVPAPPVAAERVGGITMPRFPWAATAAARAATWLRSRRLHGIVELGKRFGLPAVYRGRDTTPRLTDADRAWLAEMYDDDVAFIEGLLGRNLPAWRAAPAPAGDA